MRVGIEAVWAFGMRAIPKAKFGLKNIYLYMYILRGCVSRPHMLAGKRHLHWDVCFKLKQK